MKTQIFSILLATLSLVATSCKKDIDPIESPVDIQFIINHSVDGSELIFDSILYQNDAGNQYKVTKLEYYISNITLFEADGDSTYLSDIIYINGKTKDITVAIKKVMSGKYKKIKLNVGLNAKQNISNSLPNTSYNINMAWPDGMGGGYHFLKLEGQCKDGAGTNGYAVHLGNNISLVTCEINKEFTIISGQNLKLKMNLNEWYRSPANYDFKTDGGYTMGNMVLMKKIAANGFNIFDLE